PDVADHLTAAEGAVAGRQRAHVEAAHGPRVEVRPLRRRGLVPPRKAALALREAAASRTGLQGRGRLPLGFGREPTAGPPTVGLGSVPAPVDPGPVGLEGDPAIEVAALPAPIGAPPVEGMIGADAAPPLPAGLAPRLRTPIAAIVDESGELRLRH